MRGMSGKSIGIRSWRFSGTWRRRGRSRWAGGRELRRSAGTGALDGADDDGAACGRRVPGAGAVEGVFHYRAASTPGELLQGRSGRSSKRRCQARSRPL